MPTLKDMRLTFVDNGDTWDRVITDLDGNLIFEERGNLFTDGVKTKEEFDEWEQHTKSLPLFNIVEVVRFI